MKFTSTVMLMAGMLMPSITVAQTNSLEDTWNLLEPAFNYTNKEFQLTYKFSDTINVDSKTKATLYFYKDADNNCPNNCKSETQNNLYTGNGLTLLSSSIESTGEAFKTAKKEMVKVQLNTNVIDQDANAFVANVGGDAGTSEVKFCVRFGLCTADCGVDGSFEVNFLESLVKLTVDLRGEFTVTGIDVAPKAKITRTANQEYGLEAFQCSGKTAAGGTKYAVDLEPKFRQGDVITICVQPDVTARGDNIYMRQVEAFTYVLDGSTPVVDQAAIDITKIGAGGASAKGEMYGLTEIDDCRGEVACVIKTILFATFYTREGAVTGSGSATMQFGTAATRVRKLRGADERELQAADDVAGAGEFDVNFQIDSNDTFQGASGACSSMTILALFGSAAAALML
jgi:hypothetical protein